MKVKMILEHIPWEWPGWRWRWWWWGSAYWCSVYGKERVEIFRDVTISFFPNFLEKLCVYFGVKCPLSMSYLKRHSLVDFCFSCKPWYNLALLFDCFPVFLKIVLIVGSNFVCLFVSCRSCPKLIVVIAHQGWKKFWGELPDSGKWGK